MKEYPRRLIHACLAVILPAVCQALPALADVQGNDGRLPACESPTSSRLLKGSVTSDNVAPAVPPPGVQAVQIKPIIRPRSDWPQNRFPGKTAAVRPNGNRPGMPPPASIVMQPSPGTTPSASSSRATAAQIAAIKAVIARYQHGQTRALRGNISTGSTVAPELPSAGFTAGTPAPPKPAFGKPLPRWGDKECLCHEGMRLFKQHKYLGAAAAYRRAGQNMLEAWGRPTADVANAVRGEAVCLAEAGDSAQARDLFRKAADMYIRCSNGNPPRELDDTIMDLSQTYHLLGHDRTATMVRASRAKIIAMTRGNPQLAALEFARVATN